MANRAEPQHSSHFVLAMFLCRSFALVIPTLLGSFVPVSFAQAALAVSAEKVLLTVDVSKTGAKIDRNLFGQFAEHSSLV